MVILGIESTAHTASVGLVSDRAEVLGIASDMYRPTQGGIHPREAANHHVELFPALVERAMAAAHLEPQDVEAIAFSQGPRPGPWEKAIASTSWGRVSGPASAPGRPWPGCSRSRGTGRWSR